MKKLLLTLTALSMASVAPAALLLCQSNVNTISNGVLTNPTPINCGAIDAGAGNVITTLAVRVLGSFNDTVENTNHQLQFTGTHSSTAATQTVQTNIADLVGSGGPTSGSAVGIGTQTLAASTVSINTSLLGGLSAPSNASVAVWLDYQTAPVQTGVPEPGTMALLGSALLGVGLISRRK